MDITRREWFEAHWRLNYSQEERVEALSNWDDPEFQKTIKYGRFEDIDKSETKFWLENLVSEIAEEESLCKCKCHIMGEGITMHIVPCCHVSSRQYLRKDGSVDMAAYEECVADKKIDSERPAKALKIAKDKALKRLKKIRPYNKQRDGSCRCRTCAEEVLIPRYHDPRCNCGRCDMTPACPKCEPGWTVEKWEQSLKDAWPGFKGIWKD